MICFKKINERKIENPFEIYLIYFLKMKYEAALKWIK